MPRGYRLKVNGEYVDEPPRGWIGYEVVGMTVMCPVCVVCKEPWKDGDMLVYVNGCEVHHRCAEKERKCLDG